MIWGTQQRPGLFWSAPLPLLHHHPAFPRHSSALSLALALAATKLFKQMRPSVLAAWGRWNLSSSAGEKTDYATLSTVFFTLLFLISIVNQMNKWPLSCADGPGKYKYPVLCGKQGLLVLHPSLGGKVYFLLARQQLCWGPNFAFFYRSLKPLGFYSRWERRVMP